MARILKDYPSVSLRPEDLDGKIGFVRIFGRAGPVHIEIGTGKAAFLLNQALAQPDDNFLGIERAGRYYRYAVDRIGRWGLSNVRLIRTDAAIFLADFVPDNSTDCLHIYFPDPWPKKRHHYYPRGGSSSSSAWRNRNESINDPWTTLELQLC